MVAIYRRWLHHPRPVSHVSAGRTLAMISLIVATAAACAAPPDVGSAPGTASGAGAVIAIPGGGETVEGATQSAEASAYGTLRIRRPTASSTGYPDQPATPSSRPRPLVLKLPAPLRDSAVNFSVLPDEEAPDVGNPPPIVTATATLIPRIPSILAVCAAGEGSETVEGCLDLGGEVLASDAWKVHTDGAPPEDAWLELQLDGTGYFLPNLEQFPDRRFGPGEHLVRARWAFPASMVTRWSEPFPVTAVESPPPLPTATPVPRAGAPPSQATPAAPRPTPAVVSPSPTPIATPAARTPSLPRATDFVLDLLDGSGSLSLSSYIDRPVVLYFWASWCGFCRSEAIEVQRLWEEYGPKGVAFIGINISDTDEPARAYVKQYGWSFPVVVDRDNSVRSAYRVPGTPTLVFIRPDLRVFERQVGAVGGDALKLRIQSLLAD